MMTRLEAASGNAFDVHFTEMMAMHHDGAITMARDGLKNAAAHDLKDLAKTIISAKERAGAARAWHRQWRASAMARMKMSKS